jgi:predicted transglutaminase-like cysteine proteinase
LINRAVDLAITPTSDEAQWGVADHWSPPFETLQTHRGDCEDYAIVKYVALLQAGLSHNDVKIVILRNLLPKEDHAAVAARVEGQWLNPGQPPPRAGARYGDGRIHPKIHAR